MSAHYQSVVQHGHPPFRIAVLHGGPGGAGEVRPVARELCARGYNVLEPIQTKRSVAAQVAELKEQLEQDAEPPLVIVGWSWGAWLGCLLAERHPQLVSRLVLVGCAPFHSRYATGIAPVRQSRLTEAEVEELDAFFRSGTTSDDPSFGRAMQLSEKADSYELLGPSDTSVKFDREIFDAVWPEAEALRDSEALLNAMAKIQCPIHAIHGEADPHPSNGVEVPLRKAQPDAKFVLLEKCGHKPWRERYARDAFFAALESIVRTS